MKSEWRVSSNVVGDYKYYQVYRLKDINEVHHSGNREERPGVIEVYEEAVELARALNELEGNY